ncbi:uncharacterized protein GGS22DRAFT_165655 [Annulohypoxylon maeteangense]|uniref:uncharacterized protein n=1 Tax=Annulohypoxylon maeteangense TaxID=1927788 RepID=UPI002007395F|nr:uncharacterized protein GGS22DRAFT_165655 [Annulohypoxylon maeteangense]KAI0884465.1 hypothetical protein GGS22DRAFT_165655 [Annulohypoxylon maeteangense]
MLLFYSTSRLLTSFRLIIITVRTLPWNVFLSRPRAASRNQGRTYSLPRSVTNHLRRQQNVEPCQHALHGSCPMPPSLLRTEMNVPKCSGPDSREGNKTRPSY